MDYNKGWQIQNNCFSKLVKNFKLVIAMGVINEEMPVDYPFHIEKGSIGYVLIIYDIIELKKGEFLFDTLDNVEYFVDNYFVNCHNMVEIIANYNNYCISEDVINNKQHLS